MEKLKVMSQAAEPGVFDWYVKESRFGVDVDLFVGYGQIVQLACLRSGIWPGGMADTFGRIVSYRE